MLCKFLSRNMNMGFDFPRLHFSAVQHVVSQPLSAVDGHPRNLEASPGNLSSHLSRLEAAGYLRIQKEFAGKIPRTFLSLTEPGRRAFEDYRNKMKQLFTTPPRVRDDSDHTLEAV